MMASPKTGNEQPAKTTVRQPVYFGNTKAIGRYSYFKVERWDAELEKDTHLTEAQFNRLKEIANTPFLLLCECNFHFKDGPQMELAFTKTIGVAIPHSDSKPFVLQHRDTFWEMGCSLYLIDVTYGFSDAPDVIALTPGTDWRNLLRLHTTNGINHNLDTQDVIAKLNEWELRYPMQPIHCGLDVFEASIQIPQSECLAFAHEVYEFCPDVVDQGTGTVEDLAVATYASQSLYMWWD